MDKYYLKQQAIKMTNYCDIAHLPIDEVPKKVPRAKLEDNRCLF